MPVTIWFQISNLENTQWCKYWDYTASGCMGAKILAILVVVRQLRKVGTSFSNTSYLKTFKKIYLKNWLNDPI